MKKKLTDISARQSTELSKTSGGLDAMDWESPLSFQGVAFFMLNPPLTDPASGPYNHPDLSPLAPGGSKDSDGTRRLQLVFPTSQALDDVPCLYRVCDPHPRATVVWVGRHVARLDASH